jgi:hypothetical protein
MAKLDRSVRASDHDTVQRGATLPDGIYELEVEGTEVKKSNKGGTGINVTYEVYLPEQYKGRKFFQWINVKVPGSPKAEEIGEQELAKLIKAVGIPEDDEVDDTEELHGKPFLARVGLENLKEGDTNQPKNKIWRYFYPDEEQPQPEIFAKKEEKSRERPATGGRERPAERSREREPERGRGERERPAERSRSREREPEHDHNEGDDDDRRELDDAAEQGSREAEGRGRGGDGSANPWQGKGRDRGGRR